MFNGKDNYMQTAIRYSLSFWVIFYVAACIVLSPTGSLNIVLIRVASFIIPQMILFYFNLMILQPRYLEKNLKRTYFFILISSALGTIIAFGLIDVILDRIIPFSIKHFDERPFFYIFVGRMMSLVPPIIISALIRKSILLQIKTKESLELENKMLEAETKALKAQINPHFLFNTLNNIYSLSQFDNKKTGEAILQLSDILRYVTYDGNEQTVSLKAEIDLLESFIKLQVLRDEDDSNIHVEINVDQPHLRISPLLLLPLVENCFKHGNHHDKSKGWIKVAISTKNSTLYFETSNSTSTIEHKKDSIGGVGMENVKKRLQLLYPGNHELILRMDRTCYAALLKIKLNA